MSPSTDCSNSSLAYVIRPLEGSDFDALVELFKVVFPIKYKNEFLDAWLARNPAHCLGAFGAAGELLAFIISTQKGDDLLQIEFLGVSPLCQRGGYGTVLLGKVLDFCRKTNSRATLVPVNDHRIISWYKKHGFDFYGSPKVSSYTGEMEHAMMFSAVGCLN